VEQQAAEIEELKRKFEAQKEEVEILEEDIEEVKGQAVPKKRIILKGL
jgi:predicted RNase H-like nuclease (RuvC/YqgF family)